MDYKERYEQAIENFKKIKAVNKENKELVDFIEYKYPELKESEDERMRKQLLNWFKDCSLDTIDDGKLKREDIIAWLEKQGDITKLREEEQNRFAKGVLTSCAMSFIDYLDAHKYEGKMCVSNGECEDIENAFHNAMWDRLHRYYCKYIEKQGEQKTAEYPLTPDECVKPTEWSKEDEKMYNVLCSIVHNTYIVQRQETIDKLLSWLKSLKPRYYWKPSNRQLNKLKHE